MARKTNPRLLNANGGSGGGFMQWLPFGRSNVSNNGVPANQQPQGNPNFPSKTQLDPKNNTLDPNNANNQNGNNEPNNNPNNNPDPNKGVQGSQLDNFKDLFKVQVDDKGNPVTTTDPLAGPILNVDPQKLREAASKMNFVSGVPQELMQKVMAGNDPQALVELINLTSQQAFLQAMQVNAGVVENALTKHTARIETALPDRIRNFQIQNTAPKNPVLSHPAVAPVLDGLKRTIASANPHLSPEKVAEHAENYVTAMATDLMGANNPTGSNKQQSTQETDWNALLTGQTG
jgi:hypothetical protein